MSGSKTDGTTPNIADEGSACPDCGAPMDPVLDLCVRCYDAGGPPRQLPGPREDSALDVRFDRVVAKLPYAPPRRGLVLAVQLLLLVFSIAAQVWWLWGGAMVAWVVVILRTVAIEVDAHALTVDDHRMLWEELAQVQLEGHVVRWRQHDGRTGQARVHISDSDRDTLRRIIDEHLEQPRHPRDRAAEKAVRALVSGAPAGAVRPRRTENS